jgi:hypothetical protein
MDQWSGSSIGLGLPRRVVTRERLLQDGVTAKEVRSRLEIRALIREHRGVYRVGDRAPSVEACYLAAVFACGKGALLCGRAAAYIQGLIKDGPPPPEVLATVERRPRGVITHRVRRIEDATTWHRIPITTVPRTLVDIASSMGYGTTPRHVEAVLARRPNAPGAGKLRRIISGDAPLILSNLEQGFLRRLRGDRLPLPKTNRHAGAHYVDCRWPEHKLTVELDSYRFHSSRYAWEQDYRREREARRVPPLHVDRRLRGAGCDARRPT